MSREMAAELRERMRACKRELLQVAELRGEAEQVVQLNLPLLPLSKCKGDET